VNPEFIRQTDNALFPQILYNRPVTRSGAGRLLIPGGHSSEISQPTALFHLCVASGAGECIVALPDTLVKILAGAPSTTFVGSSPSGSLGRAALGRLLELSVDMDAVTLGVSLSSNSETSILIERFVAETVRPVIAVDEAIALLTPNPQALIAKPENLLILTMAQVFKLADQLGVPIQIRPGGGLMNKLEIIAAVAKQVSASMLIYGTETIIASPGEPLIVTPTNYQLGLYPVVYYARASVFWLQNPTNRRAGLGAACYILSRVSQHIEANKQLTVAGLGGLIRNELEAASGF
jgi:NAD(P)H-hydrate repair Nnr-like enzyme with NAD(P)H-hydrate dehydratase domain